ncbi:MAG: DUF2314 domain-containing protein [Myxococcales bacterium]|nr:DUF2314 domain-containing protein [Myxococcales bacterium]
MAHETKDEWWIITMNERAGSGPFPPHSPVVPTAIDLRVGDNAELLFCRKTNRPDDETRAEYLWVEITDIGDTTYVGLLDNQPHYIRGLQPGTPIHFTADHVAGVLVRRHTEKP